MKAVLRLAQIALALQVLLVVSGTAVRVTGSGLGCPTWPRCTGDSLSNTVALGSHGAIEFANRLLAVVMELVGIALVVACRKAPRSWRRLALVQALVVPLQAVVGGLLVLTGLNPYVLVLHFLASFPLIAAAVALLQRVRGSAPAPVRRELRLLTGALVASSALILTVGTLVTGTGPHAGDPKVARMPFNPRDITQLHADLVFLLVGLTVATVIAARALGAPPVVQRGTSALVGLVVAQGGLGYLQYFTGVPPVLVALHVLGASLVFTTAAWVHLATRPALTSPVGQPAHALLAPAEAPSLVRAAGTATAR